MFKEYKRKTYFLIDPVKDKKKQKVKQKIK